MSVTELCPRRGILEGRIAVVTGGTRGLGRAIVDGFAAEGATVVIVGRGQSQCDAVADEVRNEHGTPSTGIACDVSQWTSVERLVAMVVADVGEVDILVNNAGLTLGSDAGPGAVSERDFDAVLATNLKGPFRLSALLGEAMRERGTGVIVNVCSAGARFPNARVLAYCAAKAGLVNLTQGLAMALGPQVRVNAVLPGPMETEMSGVLTAEALHRYTDPLVMKRLATPREVAGAVLHLASDASSYTTGAALSVDGGRA